MQLATFHKSPFRSMRQSHAAAIFNNPRDFAAWLDSEAPVNARLTTKTEMQSRGTFYSGETWDTAKTKCTEGDKALAERVDGLLRKIDAATRATVRREIVEDRSRGRVSVAAYLSGSQTPCRRSIEIKTQKAPLAIAVSLNSMADVSARDLERRGAAIAALVKVTASTRPVDLYLTRFSSVGPAAAPTACLVKFPTRPLDTYRLAWLLSSQGFARGFGFAFHRAAAATFAAAGMTEQAQAAKLHETSSWIEFAGGTSYSQSNNCAYGRDLSAFLGKPVLYVPGSDKAKADFAAMTSNPVQWVNDTVAALG